MKNSTRVFLNNDLSIRCLDGTRPIIYVDKAVGAPSNKWIFSMTGGGSCNAHDSNGDGVFDDAQGCLDTYVDPKEYGEMETASEPPMKTLEGINRPGALRNPVFAGYNRVRVQKCSYDRYNGRAAYEAAGGYFPRNQPDWCDCRFLPVPARLPDYGRSVSSPAERSHLHHVDCQQCWGHQARC